MHAFITKQKRVRFYDVKTPKGMKDFVLDKWMSRAFLLIMKQKRMNPEEAFNYLMSRKRPYPWQMVKRLGGKMLRYDILKGENYGRLYFTMDYANNLRFFRQRQGKSSTAFLPCPTNIRRALEAMGCPLKAGVVYDAFGQEVRAYASAT